MKKSIFTLFVLFSCFSVHGGEALLQTTISAIPQNNPHSTREHVQPGTVMQLQASVKNVGDAPSKAGNVNIRFAFPKPLSNQENSVIFETETANLPSIAPGQQVSLLFKKKHQWPNLFNFIRNDWAMREYQAVATIDDQTQIIGALTVAFSAYYYEGASLNKPVAVSSRK